VKLFSVFFNYWVKQKILLNNNELPKSVICNWKIKSVAHPKIAKKKIHNEHGVSYWGHANHLEKIRVPSVLSSYYPNNNSHWWQKVLRGVWVPTDDHRIIIIIMKIEEKGLVDAPALNFCRAQQPADRRAIVGGARRARLRTKRRLLSAAFNSLPSNWQDGKLPNYHGWLKRSIRRA
jgi:hypothetical protein